MSLADEPVALRAVLILLRFGAGVTFVCGILLWVVLEPAANAVSEKPALRRRIRLGGIATSAFTLWIAALMVLRPS